MTPRISLGLYALPALLMLALAPAGAEPPGFVFPDVCCYHEDEVVRTVAPPAAMPHPGLDNLYAVQDGVEDQLTVVGAAPGDADYHGGKWAVHVVTWETEPNLLTSEAAVLAAAAAGDVTITRDVASDFKCPIQP